MLFDRSRRLCEQLGRPRQFASVLHGQSVYRFVRAELDRASEHAHETLVLGEKSNDVKMQHDGLYMSGVLCSVMGKFMDARAFCEGALRLWNPDFRTISASPEDPYVGIRLYYYRALVCLGHVDQGRLFRSEAVTEARRLAPFSLAYALYQHWLGDWAMDGATRADAMLQTADEILAISSEHGFALWPAFGNIQRGWCLVMLGRSAEGIELLLRGLLIAEDTGCGIVVPFFLALLAEAYGHVGCFQEALERLADADTMIETTREAWPVAEVHRLRGQVLLNMNDRAAAENSFCRALDIARRQSAKFWELRAAIDLARFWCEQGKRGEARQLLSPVYGWFTEGFDTEVLKEAKSLLAGLSG